MWIKVKSLPGFKGVPIYDVMVFFFNELTSYDLFIRANAAAFSFFLSLFPSIMALFTLIPYLKNYLLDYLPQGDNFDLILQTEIKRIMPGVAGDRLFDFIEDITSNPRVGLLSVGFLMAIFFASNGMLALMRGFEKSYQTTFFHRNFWKKRLVAIGLTFWIGLMLIGSVILVILGNSIIQWASEFRLINQISAYLLGIFRWFATLTLFYTSISFVYRFGPATKKKFALWTPGTALATVLCVLVSVAFSYYVNNFNTYNELYGSIGTIISMMLWIQLNCVFLIIGFELNASIAVNRDLKTAKEDTEF
jgi:membrane protein